MGAEALIGGNVEPVAADGDGADAEIADHGLRQFNIGAGGDRRKNADLALSVQKRQGQEHPGHELAADVAGDLEGAGFEPAVHAELALALLPGYRLHPADFFIVIQRTGKQRGLAGKDGGTAERQDHREQEAQGAARGAAGQADRSGAGQNAGAVDRHLVMLPIRQLLDPCAKGSQAVKGRKQVV